MLVTCFGQQWLMNKSLKYELVYICLIFCINMLNLSFTRERKSSCSSSFFAVFTWLFTIKSLVKRPSINTAVALRQLCVRLLSYYFLLFYQIEVQWSKTAALFTGVGEWLEFVLHPPCIVFNLSSSRGLNKPQLFQVVVTVYSSSTVFVEVSAVTKERCAYVLFPTSAIR